MLKYQYDSQEQVPGNLKDAYLLDSKSGKYTLDTLEDKHPVVVKKNELLGTTVTQTAQLAELNNRIEKLGQNVLPAGMQAVTSDVAKLGTAVSSIGLSAEELSKLKSKNEQLEKDLYDRDNRDLLRKAANAAGVTNFDAFINLPASGALNLEKQMKDGKEEFVLVSGEGKARTTTAFNREWFDKSEAFKPYIASIFDDSQEESREKGVKFPKQRESKDKKHAANQFDAIRERVRAEQAGKVPLGATAFKDAFNGRVTGSNGSSE